ncbi:MAG: hypothetical protein EBR28_05125 [Planctomycetia bacterium]|nr:hypothetical protein [Planctomycetia bacterium]
MSDRAARRARLFAAVLLAAASGWPSAHQRPGRAEQPAASSSRDPSEIGPAAEPVETVEPQELEAAIGRGVAFLLGSQRADGSWGSADNTRGGVDIYAPPPGAHHAFRGAVTALCVAALVESLDTSPATTLAIDRGQSWLLDHLPDLRRATPDTLYNVWGHAYGIETLALLHRRATDADLQARLKNCIASQVELLERYESVDGGWGYYDFRIGSRKPAASPNSFTTATVLLALADARDLGVEVPDKLIERGLESIRRQTKPDRSYIYGEYLKYRPEHPVNLPGGSVGRSQACNAALRRFGDPTLTDAAIRTWLERIVARNGWLDMGRKKPIPHESWFAVAGYFFFYGHYYAAVCLDALPAADRPVLQDQIARIVLVIQEPNGCWWDYPFYDYHTQYGTAFAVRTLVRCRHGR